MEMPNLIGKQKRVVIIGAGFAGLALARRLDERYFQVILIDRNNYHQFQPLLYQVATAGLEPSSISFPLRKIFHAKTNVFIRVAELQKVIPLKNEVETSIGKIPFDYLVLAYGAETNFFENENVRHYGYSMKSVSDALLIRNTLLQNYEQALVTDDEQNRKALLNIVIVGGGPTGVELAGAIAEMKNKLLPKDYPELNFSSMKIHLLEASTTILNGLTSTSAHKAKKYLCRMGVEVVTGVAVHDYDGLTVFLNSGKQLRSRCVIWAAGVRGIMIPGIPEKAIMYNKRLSVDNYNKVSELSNIYALGDIAFMRSVSWPKGHPQVAPVAIQQARLLAANLKKLELGKSLKPFSYADKGGMATVGRNLAVVELGKLKFKGFIAWAIWMIVHLLSVVGVKNRLFILINWIWQYITYDQSLRLIIRPSQKSCELNHPVKPLVNVVDNNFQVKKNVYGIAPNIP